LVSRVLLFVTFALALAVAPARAQVSEYDTLPEPAAPPPAAEKSVEHPVPLPTPEPKQKAKTAAPAEKELKKQGALNAKPEPKEEGDVQLGRRMAPTAAIPPFPGDEKGPKTVDFLGKCASDYDRCMETVRDVGEKLPDSEICIPTDLYFATVTERVRKWATLRPDIHGLPAGRVIAAALRSIYPCKHAMPAARTAAEKGAKGAKAAQ